MSGWSKWDYLAKEGSLLCGIQKRLSLGSTQENHTHAVLAMTHTSAQESFLLLSVPSNFRCPHLKTKLEVTSILSLTHMAYIFPADCL